MKCSRCVTNRYEFHGYKLLAIIFRLLPQDSQRAVCFKSPAYIAIAFSTYIKISRFLYCKWYSYAVLDTKDEVQQYQWQIYH